MIWDINEPENRTIGVPKPQFVRFVRSDHMTPELVNCDSR